MNIQDLTPPPGLVQEWRNQAPTARDAGATRERWIATQAARWGADAELEACCALMDSWGLDAADLHAARRPKPPSLKSQALLKTNAILNDPDRALPFGVREALELNRRALEALPDD